ncbi:MAG: MarC family protein [Candidatus Glassbacteria bacterium]|nr:MarC family protein [Candidatus Glassbacteria bacterium]
METSIISFLQAVLSLFAIVDPVGGLPVFLGLTQGATDSERRRVFTTAVITAFLVVLGFALTGSYIMRHVFHISLYEFTFAGGLLLVVVGIHEMLASHDYKAGQGGEAPEAEKHRRLHALAISPIACPLLAGPGTIVTVILFERQSGLLFAVALCVVVFSATMLILAFAGAISRLIRPIGMLAVARIMQIFIIAIGVHFMFMGLEEAFPRLFGG